MKVIVLDKRGELDLKNVKKPLLKARDILIKIIASGINPIDYQLIDSELLDSQLHAPILGRELAGIVVEIGGDVKDFKVGDAVFSGSGSMASNGTFAEYIAVPEAIVAAKPAFLSFEQAAGIPSTGITALQVYKRMKLQHSDSVFISGAAGGVGAVLIKILLANNFFNFIVTAGNEDSISSLKEIGVQENQIVNYKTDEVESVALAKNKQQKFDFVVDLVGNKMGEIASQLLKSNGVFLDVTAFSTEISRRTLFNKGATILNISNSVYAIDKNYTYYKNSLHELVDLMEKRYISPPKIQIVEGLNVESIRAALEIVRLNKTKGKKFILKISDF